MRLKKIQLLGFKSFADKTTIEFIPGITAIVGPNGCGKSNIADAFRWVLFGEQSAKAMRGNKMPDVIFAGTPKRPALNFAEVTITLANEDRMLPVDYAEVAVTRRLHRSGESDYFINGHSVRLKDVQSLFLDSGVGKNAFAIFEQGKLDQIIQFSPLERRYIFEEASGILRFLQNKREALRKLEQVELNVSRVLDIHQEVEKQITVLEEQATQARVYKENRDKLELLEKAVFVGQWDQLQRKGKELEKKEQTQQKQCSSMQQRVEQLQVDLEKSKELLVSSEEQFKEKSEAHYRIRSEREVKIRERQHSQELLKDADVKDKRWQQELVTLIEKKKL